MFPPDRDQLHRSPEEQQDEAEFLALYGPWSALTTAEVAQELGGFDRPWWVVGGLAIEAATGYRREHEDTDISLLVCDVPALVRFLTGRWHVWNNVGGVLHPLGDRWPTVDEPESQLWLRKDAASAWVLDIPLTPDADGRWTNKRVPEHVADLDEVIWTAADGIRYLLPEIVIIYKARLRRPKDDLDFDATLTVLSPERRQWLHSTLERLDAEHPWLAQVLRLFVPAAHHRTQARKTNTCVPRTFVTSRVRSSQPRTIVRTREGRTCARRVQGTRRLGFWHHGNQPD